MVTIHGSIFLLGPDYWDDGFTVAAPPWIESAVGGPVTNFQPKLLRVALAVLIEKGSNGQVGTVVMDPSDQRKGEPDDDFFRRLEVENDVDAYFVIVPARTKVMGTIFEEGMLVRDFHFGRDPFVALFPEASTVKLPDDGSIEFVERGKRTQYLKSVARHAKHVDPWEGLEDLRERVLKRALTGVA